MPERATTAVRPAKREVSRGHSSRAEAVAEADEGPNACGKSHCWKRTQAPRQLPQPVEPPGADPHAGWCGRGGVARLPPIPIEEGGQTVPKIRAWDHVGSGCSAPRR